MHSVFFGLQQARDWVQITASTEAISSTKEYCSSHHGFLRSLYVVAKRHNCMSEKIIHVSDESFDKEVLQSSQPVLIDYWAEWCGPCKMIAPALEEIAEDYSDRLTVAKLNIDDNPETPPKYGIRGIPTLMIFKNGNVEATKVGAVSKSQLTAFIDGNI